MGSKPLCPNDLEGNQPRNSCWSTTTWRKAQVLLFAAFKSFFSLQFAQDMGPTDYLRFWSFLVTAQNRQERATPPGGLKTVLEAHPKAALDGGS